MRQSSSTGRTGLVASLGVTLLTICASAGQAASEETPPKKRVVDSGWAVSAPEESNKPADGKPANGKFVKPSPGKPLPAGKKPSPKDKKLAASTKQTSKSPRIAALPRKAEASAKDSTRTKKSLNWVPAGISASKPPTEKKKSATSKSAAPQRQEASKQDATKPPQEEQKTPQASDVQKPATKNSDAKKSPEPSPQHEPSPEKTDKIRTAKKSPRLPVKKPLESEPKEPAPFPEVIEVAEEPNDEVLEEPAKEAKPNASANKRQRTSAAPQAVASPKPLTRYQRSLRSKLRTVLSYYYRRPLNSIDHDPWEVMHHMLAYGQHSRILDGSRRGKPMTAVGYLCFNMPCQGKQMMSLTADGLIETRVDVGMQGHKGQLMAMLAQCGISPEYPVRVEGKKLKIADLIHAEKLSCYAGEELSFKLIGLSHYLETDDTWVNDQGETWSFPRLIREERNQKIRGAPCGGTHRLSGLSLAVRKRRQLGLPIDGEYLEAQRFVQQYVNYAYRWQNSDGSLSTEWFRGPGAEEDINRRVRTTGHLLEWLLYTVPDEQLADTRILRAVNYLTGVLASNTNNPWEIGPLSHALHALLLYDERAFSPHDAELIAAAERSGHKSQSPENLNYRNIDSRVVRSLPSADEADAARAELANASTGLRGLFSGARRKSSYRSR